MNAFRVAFEEGQAKFQSADYRGARELLQRARALAKDHDSTEKLADAQRLAGDIAGAEGRLREAKACFADAWHLHDFLHQENAKPALDEALGDVETRLGEYDEAAVSLARSLHGYRSYRLPVGVAMATRDLGTLAFHKNDLDGAERWFRESLEALKAVPNLGIETDVLGRRALVMLKRGQKAEARAALTQCLAFWTKEAHPRWIALCEMRLGLAEAALGDSSGGSARIARSRDGFARVGDAQGVREANDALRGLVAQKTKARESGPATPRKTLVGLN